MATGATPARGARPRDSPRRTTEGAQHPLSGDGVPLGGLKAGERMPKLRFRRWRAVARHLATAHALRKERTSLRVA